MNRTELELKKEEAYNLGWKAFEDGLNIIPASNPALKPLIAGMTPEDVSQFKAIIEAYQRGFLAAPVQDGA